MRRRLARWARTIGRVLALAILGLVFAFPLYWAITMAFKPAPEWQPTGTGKTYWFPEDPTLENFRIVFNTSSNTSFLTGTFPSAVDPILNSLVAATGGTALALVLGIPAAYGITRFGRKRRRFASSILLVRIFPPLVFVIPLFFLWVQIGLVDTYPGLILVYGALTFPFAVWLMRSFFLGVPREVGEAAIVDGCSHWTAFTKAVLPLVKGGIAATAFFLFILNWSDLLIAVVITREKTETATVYLNGLRADEIIQFGPQAAVGLLLMLPPLILGIAIRNHLARGLTLGAVRQ